MTGSALAPILAEFIGTGIPANIALMRLMMAAESPGEVAAAIDAIAAADPVQQRRLEQIRLLLAGNAGAFATIRAVMAQAEHDRAPDATPDAVAHWAGVFDRLARMAPEAGVALYALGSPDLLRDATGEVVALMRGWGLVGPDNVLLEIGCGIGRLSLALAPFMQAVIGLDVSGEMVAEAGRRGRGRANASFRQTGGRDLAGIPDDSIDVVLAADVFPYLVAAGDGLARRHVEEAARVLQPGGALLILNYSYRGDDTADRAEVATLFAASGVTVERLGTRDLALWDAAAFLGRKPSRSGT
jgi:SAM-dependent methyltransferase